MYKLEIVLYTWQYIRTALLNNMAEYRHYFSQLEKSLLTELVRKHKDLLEDKKNDYKTIQQKNKTWEALSEQFNSQSGVTKRDSRQLKKCWENVKARAKKQLANGFRGDNYRYRNCTKRK